MFLVHDVRLLALCWAIGSHRVPPSGLIVKQSLLPGSLLGQTLPSVVFCTDDESPGLYGFLNVIVHSATGFKQSSSKWLIWGGRRQDTEPEGVGNQGSVAQMTIRRL